MVCLFFWRLRVRLFVSDSIRLHIMACISGSLYQTMYHTTYNGLFIFLEAACQALCIRLYQTTYNGLYIWIFISDSVYQRPHIAACVLLIGYIYISDSISVVVVSVTTSVCVVERTLVARPRPVLVCSLFLQDLLFTADEEMTEAPDPADRLQELMMR